MVTDRFLIIHVLNPIPGVTKSNHDMILHLVEEHDHHTTLSIITDGALSSVCVSQSDVIVIGTNNFLLSRLKLKETSTQLFKQ